MSFYYNMGVNIRDLVSDVKEEIEYKDLSSKIIAVDAFNMIYQFLSAIRQPDGSYLIDSQGNITSHLSGLFYRNISLIEQGIKLIYIFDGEKPSFKEEEIKRREKLREEAKEKWIESLEKGEIEEAKKYAQAAIFLDEKMIEESKELLRALGIGVVQAPSEGEAQAAYMTKKGICYASASQDYDSLLFGTKVLVRNLGITGKRKIPGINQYKEVNIERIVLENLLNKYELTQEQLICLGIIVGTDYAENGVEGYGVKKALEVVKVYKTPQRIAKAIKDKWHHDVDFMEIYEFFSHPPVKDVKINFPSLDENKVKEILVERHDFSLERVNNGLEKLKKARSRSMQKTLF